MSVETDSFLFLKLYLTLDTESLETYLTSAPPKPWAFKPYPACFVLGFVQRGPKVEGYMFVPQCANDFRSVGNSKVFLCLGAAQCVPVMSEMLQMFRH